MCCLSGRSCPLATRLVASGKVCLSFQVTRALCLVLIFRDCKHLATQVLNVLKYQIVDITSRLTPQPSGSGGGGGTSSSIAKAESIGRSITSILGNSSSSSAEISGGAAGPSTSALPPMQQVPLVRRRKGFFLSACCVCVCAWEDSRTKREYFRLFCSR